MNTQTEAMLSSSNNHSEKKLSAAVDWREMAKRVSKGGFTEEVTQEQRGGNQQEKGAERQAKSSR